MKKSELVELVSVEAGFTKKDTEAFINAYGNVVYDALVNKHDTVTVGDVGRLVIAETKAREERVMKSGLTGEEVVIPAKEAGYKVAFKASKKVKDAFK